MQGLAGEADSGRRDLEREREPRVGGLEERSGGRWTGQRGLSGHVCSKRAIERVESNPSTVRKMRKRAAASTSKGFESTNSDVYAPECECETLCTPSDPASLVRACARLALRFQAVVVVASLAVLVDCTAHHVVGTAPRPLDEPCSRPGSCNPRVSRTHRHFPRSTRGRSERAEAAKGEEAEKGRRPRAGHGQPRTEPGTRVPREQGRTL